MALCLPSLHRAPCIQSTPRQWGAVVLTHAPSIHEVEVGLAREFSVILRYIVNSRSVRLARVEEQRTCGPYLVKGAMGCVLLRDQSGF